MYIRTICLGLLLLVLISLVNAQKFDIIIYGSTPSGLAAAISVSMFNPRIAVGLLYPGVTFGGMSVDGYIGLRDINVEGPLNNTIARKWAMINAKYYNVSYPVFQLDQSVAKQSFLTLLSRYPNIKVYPNTTLTQYNSTIKQGTTITAIQCITDQGVKTFKASVFIDASYEADLVRFSNTSYTYGRESVEQYHEYYAGVRPYTQFSNFIEESPVLATLTNSSDVLIPFVQNNTLGPVGSADQRLMGYSFRLCLTTNVNNQHDWSDIKPNNYNSSDFILFQRYLDSILLSEKNSTKGPDITDLYLVSPYRSYPPGDKYDLCDSQGSAFTSDAINLNQGYVDGTYEQRLEIANQIAYYVLGGLYFLASGENVPSNTQKSVRSYGVCKDQPILPPQLYVREGVRLVGDKVFTQNDVLPGKMLGDSIGLGSWWYDIHVVSRTAIKNETTGNLFVNNEGQVFQGSGDVYEIPITILFPKKSETTNLLVTSCPSTSHVSFASIRVEPTFMTIGESAGIVAGLAVLNSIYVQAVDPSDVQFVLGQRGIAFHWNPSNN